MKHPGRPRILVIRGGALGDFVLTLPGLALLRKNFPETHLELLGYPHIARLALGSYVDKVRSIEYGPLSRFFIPNGELDPELEDYFASFQQIISYLYDPDGFFHGNLRRIGVKHLITASPKVDPEIHAADFLAEPLQTLALYLETPYVQLPLQDHPGLDQLLPSDRKPMVAIHPGSGSPMKNWPREEWAALGPQLSRDHTILLLGGEADQPQVDFLKEKWRDLPVRTILNQPLPLVASLLGHCAFFVGHDSGISHLAAATGIPCLLLFGHTDPSVWAPRNPRVRVLSSLDHSMRNLPRSEVEREIDNIQRSLRCNIPSNHGPN